MRIFLCITLALPLAGCYTQTHTVRTVKHTDGSTEIYENHSTGYNYNPNFTGTSDTNHQIRANTSSTQSFSAGVTPFTTPVSPNGQYTIR